MRKLFSYILIITGGLLVIGSLFLIIENKMTVKQSLQEAESLISIQPVKTNIVANHSQPVAETEETIPSMEELRAQFSPEEGDAIGVLHIPKIDAKLPIIEGTDEDELAKGVGHYTATVFPGDGEQILLSGHRDTVFRQMGELEIGDTFIVEMPYGRYEYEMKESEIVEADDRTVIRSMGEEVLTLSTCYPFNFIGNAPDRYIIYAYPVTSEI